MQAVGQFSTRSGRTLLDRAVAVLRANAADRTTPSAPGVGAHLNSWSIALTAIGYAHVDPLRAAEELSYLFNGQWKNGLLPHLGFVDDATELAVPGPRDWDSRRVPESPDGMSTSGIVHPPLHATAVLRVANALEFDGTEFLRVMYPRLAAWHDYLLSSRVRDDVPLAEVWHPWETAMDNSPMWDAPLAAARNSGDPTAVGLRASPDTAIGLVGLLRELDFSADRIRACGAFAVHDVMFNSMLVRAELDLSEIALRVGHNANHHTLRSRRGATALNRELFDPHEAWYVDRDVLSGRPLALASASQLTPLYAGVPDPSRAALLVDMWRAMSAPRSSPLNGMMASADPEQREFSLTNGWRGPAWFSTNWLVHEGLRAYGYELDASRLRNAMLSAVAREGFREHYDIFSGAGNGFDNSSCTAAITVDLLATERLEPDVA